MTSDAGPLGEATLPVSGVPKAPRRIASSTLARRSDEFLTEGLVLRGKACAIMSIDGHCADLEVSMPFAHASRLQKEALSEALNDRETSRPSIVFLKKRAMQRDRLKL